MGSRKEQLKNIKQRPITDSMTKEERKEYDNKVREARYANNASSVDFSYARGGRSIFVEPKPMSDTLSYWPPMKYEVNLNEKEVNPMLPYTTKEKEEYVKKQESYIEAMKRGIETIKADKNLTVAEKQRKIAIRMEKINIAEYSKAQAEEFIRFQHAKYKELEKTK